MATGLVQTNLIGPGQDSVQIAGELGRDQINGAVDDDTLGTVDGDDIALAQHAIAAFDTYDLLGRVDVEALDAADTGRTHAAGDNGGMVVLPPWLVRMPSAATMPFRSSGLVSQRTRMTL